MHPAVRRAPGQAAASASSTRRRCSATRSTWSSGRTAGPSRLADGYEGFLEADALGEPPPKDRAHVVVVPQAADRYMGTWLPSPGLRTEPLAAARRKATGEAIAEAALMFLGAPYEWGGVTVEGLDCSGLVQAVHRRFGTLLPRNADQQETAGAEVATPDARPGDLFCYGDHIADLPRRQRDRPRRRVARQGGRGGAAGRAPQAAARRPPRFRRRRLDHRPSPSSLTSRAAAASKLSFALCRSGT